MQAVLNCFCWIAIPTRVPAKVTGEEQIGPVKNHLFQHLLYNLEIDISLGYTVTIEDDLGAQYLLDLETNFLFYFMMKLPFDPPGWLERRASKAWKPPGKNPKYWCQIDFIHPMYPKSPLDLLPILGLNQIETHPRSDYITALPTEIFEEIMVHLSTAELDAARFVSRRWWERIMTSRMILRSSAHRFAKNSRFILELTPLLTESNIQSATLRDLAHNFDQTCHIRLDQEMWRVPYRASDINFLPSEAQDQIILNTALLSTGEILAFLMETDTQPHKEYSVLVYMVKASVKPFLIRSIGIPAEHGKPLSMYILDGTFPVDWTIELHFQHSQYSVPGLLRGPAAPIRTQVPERSYPNQNTVSLTDSYKLIPGSGVKSPESWKIGTWSAKELAVSSVVGRNERSELDARHQDWIFLEKLPLFGHASFNGTQLKRRCHWIAQSRANDQLFVVRFQFKTEQTQASASSRSDSEFPSVVPIHLLSAPYRHQTYKNIAVAARQDDHATGLPQLLRVGVIWSAEANKIDCSGVLFLYDIYFLSNQSFLGYVVDFTIGVSSLGKWIEQVPEEEILKRAKYLDDRLLNNLELPEDWMAERPISTDPSRIGGPGPGQGRIYGKRVCSLPVSVGGLHQALNLPNGVERPLNSGISIKSSEDSDILIWGPSHTSQPGIKLRYLDLSPSKKCLGIDTRTWYNVDTIRQAQEENVSAFNVLVEEYPNTPGSPSCACKLHDSRWNVTFPITPRLTPSKVWKASLGDLKRYKDSQAQGAVTYVPMPLATEAVARRNRQLIAHLECLKSRTAMGFGSV